MAFKFVMGGWAAHSWLTFSHKVFNLLSSNLCFSCDAMFFSVGSQFFGEKCIFWRFHKFLCKFHNSKTIQGIWMDLYEGLDLGGGGGGGGGSGIHYSLKN